MAYTSGVFRIDLVSGSDAARTALTSCTASNPAGSTTRINKTAHGLVTGAVVDLTLFSSWLNDAWKITVVDADNFDLDAATWQATADASGTVTPRGGSSWTDAWLTVNSGATAARIQPGDEIRFAKTADPVSLAQNATWTDGSQTVTLTTAVTKKIEDASSGWTAATNITASTNATRKLGSTAVLLQPAAGFTTGKMAYAAIAGGGTQDFSAYQYINFWFRPATSSISFASGDFKICLCSDATGDVIVNEINLPAIQPSTTFNALSLNYGGNLSASVQSVAIYANVDPGTANISFNNIFASAGNLSLKTLIGKTGDVNYNIQSIDGTTIKIDSNNTSATGRGYSGSTSTETLYYRVPFDVATTGGWATTNEVGNTLTSYNHYIGGYNTSNDTRDGVTCIASTMIGNGIPFVLSQYNKLSYFTMARFTADNNNFSDRDYDNCVWCGAAAPFSNSLAYYHKFSNCKFLNLSAGSVLGGYCDYSNCEFRSSSGVGVNAYSGARFESCTFSNNTTASIAVVNGTLNGTGGILLRNCTLSDSTEFTFTHIWGFAWSFDHDNTTGNNWGVSSGATINWQTSTFHASEPGAWKFIITSSTRTSYRPATLMLGPFQVAASATVTVKAWIKKDHATNVAAKLYVEDAAYNLDGVSATSSTKASDTSWEELTITFTPTQAGAIPVFVDAWYVAGASNVYVGTITVTQA
jgi:hypothetical protein